MDEVTKNMVTILRSRVGSGLGVFAFLLLCLPLCGNACAVAIDGDDIRHDGGLESPVVLLKENNLLLPGSHYIHYVTAAVCGWEIDSYPYVWKKPSDCRERRNQIGICADKNHFVRAFPHTVFKHPDGDVHIGLLLLRARNGEVTRGADNLLREIFSTYNLESTRVSKFVGVQECSLSRYRTRVKWRGREIDNPLQCLLCLQKAFAEANDINPVKLHPASVGDAHPFQAVVEVESVNIERHSFHYWSSISKKAATRAAKSTQESVALLGGMIPNCASHCQWGVVGNGKRKMEEEG